MGSGSGPDPIFILGAFCQGAAWGGGFVGRSCGCERRFAGGDLGLAGLCGALPAASGGWRVWLVLRALRARARLLMNRFAAVPEPFGPVLPERRGCAGGCVCEWPQTNLSLKFNFYFIFRGKIFEQKLDIAFIMF